MRMPSWGGIAVRIVAALLGGYLLGALASVAGLALPVAATEAVLGGTLLSFAIFAIAVLVAFAWRSGRGLRQSMAGLHTWAGLLAGWVLYAMFFTGTLSYFRAEISAWMRPELATVMSLPVTSSRAPCSPSPIWWPFRRRRPRT